MNRLPSIAQCSSWYPSSAPSRAGNGQRSKLANELHKYSSILADHLCEQSITERYFAYCIQTLD
ncbi:hypothetical protein V4V35_25360 [Bacillus infantis]|uniref:hypothetical protein n=1 Tax=Bacillus infantis TaxID=324767 RepID=UPI002FBDD715